MYGWIVTHDHINHGQPVKERETGTIGPGCIRKVDESLLKELVLKSKCISDSLPEKCVRWRVYDDDNELYFEGIMVTDNPGSEDWFSPLDDLGTSYGCVYIQIQKVVIGAWETL